MLSTHRYFRCPHLARVITTNENERSTVALYTGADAAVDRTPASYNGLLLLLVKAAGSYVHPLFVSRNAKQVNTQDLLSAITAKIPDDLKGNCHQRNTR